MSVACMALAFGPCFDGSCLRYHRHCAPAAEGIACDYRMIWPGILPDGPAMITADDDAALHAAEREVSLVFTRDGKEAKLPFALVTARSRDAPPPDCPGAAYDACDPP